MTDQDVQKIYNDRQAIIDAYHKQSQESYRKDQQAKDPRITTSKAAETNNQISRKERDEARKIQRELRRFAATGRISKFLEETFQKNFQQNNLDNSSPNSTINQSPPFSESPKITSSGFAPYTGKTQVQSIVELASVEVSRCPLGLRIQNKEVWITAGNIGNFIPEDWGGDNINGKFIASNGNGYVYVQININIETGEILFVLVNTGSSIPNNTNDTFYYPIGYYEYSNNNPTVTNYDCGSIEISICRNWFASEAPFYSVSFIR